MGGFSAEWLAMREGADHRARNPEVAAALRAAFDELTAKLQAQPKTLSQRLADAGFKRRPSSRSLPSDE
mgnify:CR=1 FL=1